MLKDIGLIDYTRNDLECLDCMKNNVVKKHVINNNNNKINTDNYIHSINSDIFGPIIKPITVEGYKSFVSFIIKQIEYIIVYGIKSKNEVPDILIELINKLDRKFPNMKLEILISDRGSEYCNNKVESFIKSNGIQHVKVPAEKHELNGNVESLNWIIMQKVRVIISRTRLPKNIWVRIVKYVVDNINITNIVAKYNKTSYALFNKKEFSYSRCREIGLVGYCRTLDQERTRNNFSKLDSYGRLCIMVGYALPTGYIVLFPTSNNIIRERVDILWTKNMLYKDYMNMKPVEKYDITKQLFQALSIKYYNINKIKISNNNENNNENNDHIGENNINNTTHDNNPDNNVRKTSRISKQVDYGPVLAHDSSITEKLNNNSIAITPKNKHEAIKSKVWLCALAKEYMAHAINGNLIPLVDNKLNGEIINENKNIIKTKDLFSWKTDDYNNPIRAKARLIMQGFSQKFVDDYLETYSAVINPILLKVFLYYCVKAKWEIYCMDIPNAYTHANLDRDNLVCFTPNGYDKLYELRYKVSLDMFDTNEWEKYISDSLFTTPTKSKYCNIVKAFNGAKQAGRCYQAKIFSDFEAYGLVQLSKELCWWIKWKENNIVLILIIHVDDIAYSGLEEEIESFKLYMVKLYNIKDLGLVKNFLGLQILRHKNNGDIFIHMEKHNKQILSVSDMDNCNGSATPADSNIAIEIINDDLLNEDDKKRYQSILGAIMYASNKVMFPLLNITNNLSSYMNNARVGHLNALKRSIRYIKDKVSYGLIYSNTNMSEKQILVEIYSDSDWARDKIDRKSRSGGCIMIDKCLVDYWSKKQAVVNTSSMNSELTAMSFACQRLRFVVDALKELKLEMECIMYVDSDAAAFVTRNQIFNASVRHLHIKQLYVMECYKEKLFKIQVINSDNNCSDMYTKHLGKNAFNRHCNFQGFTSKEIFMNRELNMENDEVGPTAPFGGVA